MKENEKNNQNNIKSELIECLLHVSDERKPFVQNYGDFLKLGEMIRLIYPELDQSQKMKITQRLLNQNSSVSVFKFENRIFVCHDGVFVP